jgi:DNA-binding MarR family transcriptional regulator
MGSRGIITAELSSVDDDAGAALIGFDTLVQKLDRLLDHLLVDKSLNESAVQALRVVESVGRSGVRQCVLAEVMNQPAATISRLVDTLVKNDLIRRSSHPTDRRVTLLTLTAVGEQHLARRRANYSHLADVLTPRAVEAMRAISPLLDLVVQTLEASARDEAA